MKAIILFLVSIGTMNAQFFGGGNATRLRGIPIASLSGCTTGQQITFNGTSFVCDAAGAGTGITSLEGQTGATQTFTDDTNVTIVSGSNAHVITWAGTLALTRGGTGASTASGARTNLGLGWAGGFDLVLTSSTVLDIAAGYAVKGSTATSIAADTITWATGASGSIAFYIDYTSTPALGCAVTSITVTGITCVSSGSEPANRVPLYSVPVTSSQFQAGWSDFRTGVVTNYYTNGSGLALSSNSFSIDTTLVTQKFIVGAAPGNVAGSTRGDLAYDTAGEDLYVCKNATTCAVSGDWVQVNGAAGSGDVVGPASSTDNAVARFDTTTGKLLQNTSTLTLSDAGAFTFADGVKQTFNPDGTNAGFNFGSQAGNPSSLADGDGWYNSTTKRVMSRIDGVTVPMAYRCIETAATDYFLPFGTPIGGVAIYSPSLGANKTMAWAFTPPCTMTISLIDFNVQTASGTCGGTCGAAWAFYETDGTFIVQSTTLTSGGTPDINTTGYKVATLTAATTLQGGKTYFMALSTNSTVLEIVGSSTFLPGLVNQGSNIRTGTGSNSSGTSTITMPSPLGTLTVENLSGRIPVVALER